MDVKQFIRTIPDYPKDGILFRDITTLLSDPVGFRTAIDALVQLHQGAEFDVVAGIEARGFILGGAVAHQLGLGFVPVRKKGKLPFSTMSQEYDLEYGTDVVEIHTVKLITRAGGNVMAASFVIELPVLGGRERLEALDIEVLSLCSYDGH